MDGRKKDISRQRSGKYPSLCYEKAGRFCLGGGGIFILE
jgi:hypothetical protein